MPSKEHRTLQELNDDYEDGLLRLAMDELATKEGAAYLAQARDLNLDPANAPTAESLRKFTKLLDKNLKACKRERRRLSSFQIINKISVAVLIVVLLFSTLMVTVKAFRQQVFNFMISIESEFTSFQIQDSDKSETGNELIVNWTNSYVPTYIPDGYQVSTVTYSDSLKKIIFVSTNGEATIIYSEFITKGGVSIDTENASLIEKVEINGAQEGTLMVKDSTVTLVWDMDDHMFVIQGQISADEAIIMANGVIFIE